MNNPRFREDVVRSGITQYTLLKNGLKVVLIPDKLSQVVSSVILYKVGSRNEACGYTGSTHFLEHMMFMDTSKHSVLNGNGFDQVFKPLGNLTNANTWYDRTMYFECVPSEYLETCLEIEADRMRNLKLTQMDHDSEMTVVRNELERGETEPDEMMENQKFATIFREHPYHHPTIGWRSDVEGMPLARLKQFYDEFYWPNNAVLFISGNFDTSNALKLVYKHFGKIKLPKKPIPEVYTTEPKQMGQRSFELYTQTQLKKLTVAFRLPESTHVDLAAMRILDEILGNSQMPNSPIYKQLISTGLAFDAHSSLIALKDHSIMSFEVALTDSQSISSAQRAIENLINGLKLNLDSSQSQIVTQAKIDDICKHLSKRKILSAMDGLNLAQELAEYEGRGSWLDYFDEDSVLASVTVDNVVACVNKYFTSANSTVGKLYPSSQLDDKNFACKEAGHE